MGKRPFSKGGNECGFYIANNGFRFELGRKVRQTLPTLLHVDQRGGKVSDVSEKMLLGRPTFYSTTRDADVDVPD
jgi:hypothetical protein